MVVQFPGGDPFSNTLKETSKKAEATEEQYDRILQSVLKEVGKPGAASYAKAATAVDRMASANVNRIVNRVIASGTGVAVLAASLFLVVSSNTTVADAPTVSITDEQVPLDNLPPGYTVDIPMAAAGPVFDGVSVDDGFLTIFIAGGTTETFWETLYGLDGSGNRVEPAETDPEQGLVRFALPVERLELYFIDDSGNQAKMALRADE